MMTPLHDRVITIKNEIDRIAPAGFWDDVKKITNPYEYIFLSLQRRMHRSVAAIVPLSRSYFKMIELWDVLGLSDASRTAHTAEGPGGFLEAIQDRMGHTTAMTAMTLKSTERTIPGWRKSQAFLNRHPNITIMYGPDGTGNLYSLANQDAYAAAAAEATVYTADGGFDFSADFNGQENTVQRLLVAEALAGLTTLKVGGTMIIKMFDTKNRATLELIWILSTCFDKTGLIKPFTSRPANSERYWVGQGLLPTTQPWVLPLLRSLTATDAPNGWDQLFVEPPWTPEWLTTVQTFQETLETHQFNKIELTLNLIRTPSRAQVQTLLRDNIANSRRWCIEHRLPINRRYADLSDDQIVAQNLEEALEPFPTEVARMNSPGPFPRGPMPRASTFGRPLQPPTVLAWRSALPLSVLGRSPSHTVSDTLSYDPPAQNPSGTS
jgi:23S rRNA U2552 (ribose-2'-O)-methylase RlmE/FtsJ